MVPSLLDPSAVEGLSASCLVLSRDHSSSMELKPTSLELRVSSWCNRTIFSGTFCVHTSQQSQSKQRKWPGVSSGGRRRGSPVVVELEYGRPHSCNSEINMAVSSAPSARSLPRGHRTWLLGSCTSRLLPHCPHVHRHDRDVDVLLGVHGSTAWHALCTPPTPDGA